MSEATPSSGKYPPKSRVRRAAPVAVTLVQSVSRTITIAGFPLSTWAFALRIWAAMMVALYAAFWLQLESASSAAVTVAILASQTRGQTYQKAAYRVLATARPSRPRWLRQWPRFGSRCYPRCRRERFEGADWDFTKLQRNRAYSAVLSGYTVALVAMTQIDSPTSR